MVHRLLVIPLLLTATAAAASGPRRAMAVAYAVEGAVTIQPVSSVPTRLSGSSGSMWARS